MLARIITLFPWTPAPPPSVELRQISPRGTWLVWKEGGGYHCETPIGTEKVVDVQRVIEGARRAGAIIKWLD